MSDKNSEMKKLLEHIHEIDNKLSGYAKATESLSAAKSAAIKELFETAGTNKLRYKGEDLTIVSRKAKGGDEVRWYLRGEREPAPAVEVE